MKPRQTTEEETRLAFETYAQCQKEEYAQRPVCCGQKMEYRDNGSVEYHEAWYECLKCGNILPYTGGLIHA